MAKKYINDILLILGIILFIIVMIIIFKTGITGENLRAEVWHKDELIDEINLSSLFLKEKKEYDIEGHIIIVEYEKDTIWVAQSDCPNQICVKTGKSHSPTKPIICMEYNFRIVLKNNTNTYDLIIG